MCMVWLLCPTIFRAAVAAALIEGKRETLNFTSSTQDPKFSHLPSEPAAAAAATPTPPGLTIQRDEEIFRGF